MSEHELLRQLPADDRLTAAIRREAVEIADFRICGNRVRLRANQPGPIQSFRKLYRWFEITTEEQAPDIELVCQWIDASGRPAIRFLIEGELHEVDDALLMEHLYTPLAFLILSRIRTHFLIHAGCVERRAKAVVITGHSGMGKSTLTTFLTSRGMGYLSDEFAPLNRRTCEIVPFPLPVGVRPGPGADFLSDVAGEQMDFPSDPKKLVQPHDLGKEPVDYPAKLHAVIILAGDVSSRVRTSAKFEGKVRLLLLATTPEFERELLIATGSTLVEKDLSIPKTVQLTLQVTDATRFLPAVMDVTERHHIPLGGVQYEDLDPADFNRSPQLVRIPPAAGVLELVKRIPSHQKQRLVAREFGGRVPALVEEMSRLVRDVAFYKLSPGRLDEMLDLIEGLP